MDRWGWFARRSQGRRHGDRALQACQRVLPRRERRCPLEVRRSLSRERSRLWTSRVFQTTMRQCLLPAVHRGLADQQKRREWKPLCCLLTRHKKVEEACSDCRKGPAMNQKLRYSNLPPHAPTKPYLQ